MTDGVVVIPPDSSGKKIDTSELTRADGTVIERQRISIGDPIDPTQLADVANALLTGNEYGLVTRGLPTSTDMYLAQILSSVLTELRLLRQSFQDWSGQPSPRQSPGIDFS